MDPTAKFFDADVARDGIGQIFISVVEYMFIKRFSIRAQTRLRRRYNGLSMFGPPGPIDPSYTPSASITRISANAPIEDILAIIERDGGVILTAFATPEHLAAIDRRR